MIASNALNFDGSYDTQKFPDYVNLALPDFLNSILKLLLRYLHVLGFGHTILSLNCSSIKLRSCKNVEELWSESFAFRMTGRKIPKPIDDLLDRSLTHAKDKAASFEIADAEEQGDADD